MNRSKPAGDRLLQGLIGAAREDQPHPRLLNDARAALGLLGAAATHTSGGAALGVASGEEAASASAGAMAPEAISATGVAGSASTALGVGASGGLATGVSVATATVVKVAPLAIGKWFAIGLVSGSVALGGGAAVERSFIEPVPAVQPSRDASPVNAALAAGRRPRQVAFPGGSPSPDSSVSTFPLAPIPSPSRDARAAKLDPVSGNVGGLRSTEGVSAAASESSAQPEARSIRRQLAAIESSRAAMQNNAPADAEASARTYLRAFPDGVFVPEALYLTMEAQVRMGDLLAAQHSAAQLVKRFPRSVQSVKARERLRGYQGIQSDPERH